MPEGEEDEEDEEEEMDDEESKTSKKLATMQKIYEPGELERAHLTSYDELVRRTDMPERLVVMVVSMVVLMVVMVVVLVATIDYLLIIFIQCIIVYCQHIPCN